MELGEDEKKIILGLLYQLNFKLADAAIVLPIIEKLKAGITEPELSPETKPETPTVDAEIVAEAPAEPIP